MSLLIALLSMTQLVKAHFRTYASISSDSVLLQTVSPYMVDVTDYHHDLVSHLTNAWDLAGTCIKGAQGRQKQAYDRTAKDD